MVVIGESLHRSKTDQKDGTTALLKTPECYLKSSVVP